MSRLLGFTTAWTLAVFSAAQACAQVPAGSFSLAEAPEQARTLLTDLALAAIPNEYEKTKDWGRTKEVWDGVHMRMDGIHLRTKRKWKTANHGTWKMYRVTMIDPEQNLRSEIKHLREIGPGRVAFQLSMAAKVHAYARLQEWRRGIRLLSITAESDSDLELDVAFEMTTELDSNSFPPDLLLKPEAKTADLRLVQFKLTRVSKADGPVIRELGDGLEDILRKLIRDRRAELAGKINRAIQKNSDSLRLSLSDLVGGALTEPESQSVVPVQPTVPSSGHTPNNTPWLQNPG